MQFYSNNNENLLTFSKLDIFLKKRWHLPNKLQKYLKCLALIEFFYNVKVFK